MTTPSVDPALLEAAGVTEQQVRDEMLSPDQLEGLAAEKREAEVRAEAAANGYSYDDFQLVSSLQSLAQAAPAPAGYRNEMLGTYRPPHGFYGNGAPGDYEGDPSQRWDYDGQLSTGHRAKRAKPETSYYGYPLETRKSSYRGVSWFKRGRKWRVAIKISDLGKNDIHIGFFVHEEDAARAYDVTLLGFYGRNLMARHKTNFDSEEYTFDKIPALLGQSREGIREELESWFGPARFAVVRNGMHVYEHQRPGYKQLESLRSAGYARSYDPELTHAAKHWSHGEEDGDHGADQGALHHDVYGDHGVDTDGVDGVTDGAEATEAGEQTYGADTDDQVKAEREAMNE